MGKRKNNRLAGERRAKRGLLVLAIAIAVAVVAFVVVAVLAVQQSSMQTVQVSAQDDAAALEAEEEDKTTVRATSEVVKLASLLGMTQSAAVESIGHGASVEGTTPIDAGALRTRVQVLLTDEKGDALSGTPTVMLYLDSSGVVASASYSASTSALGYGAVSFANVIEEMDIVQNTVAATGLSSIDPTTFSVPIEREDYCTFESDGETSVEESMDFTGTGTAPDGSACRWLVNVTYDYSEANASGNLADTIRTVSVTVTRA